VHCNDSRWLPDPRHPALAIAEDRSGVRTTVELKVGISEPVNTVLAIWMADAAGFYEAAGIKLEIINMNGGSRGAAELAAGRIDAMHVGLSSVVQLNRTGGDLRIVASLANVIRFTFFSARTSRPRPISRAAWWA
jgi:ABC-type nitrate/sulfonate/bicarbonate transport system substrate-binding protein